MKFLVTNVIYVSRPTISRPNLDFLMYQKIETNKRGVYQINFTKIVIWNFFQIYGCFKNYYFHIEI